MYLKIFKICIALLLMNGCFAPSSLKVYFDKVTNTISTCSNEVIRELYIYEKPRYAAKYSSSFRLIKLDNEVSGSSKIIVDKSNFGYSGNEGFSFTPNYTYKIEIPHLDSYTEIFIHTDELGNISSVENEFDCNG